MDEKKKKVMQYSEESVSAMYNALNNIKVQGIENCGMLYFAGMELKKGKPVEVDDKGGTE